MNKQAGVVPDNYVPYGEEWKKEMMKMSKERLVEFIKRNATKKDEQPIPVNQDDDMTFKEMLLGLFNVDFMTSEEFNTICDAGEMYAKAKQKFLSSPSPTPVKQTDFQIAWELSKTADKPFFIDTFRKLLGQYDNDDISLSKFVEELNIAAYKWKNLYATPVQEGLAIEALKKCKPFMEEMQSENHNEPSVGIYFNDELADAWESLIKALQQPTPVQEGLREDENKKEKRLDDAWDDLGNNLREAKTEEPEW